MLVEKDTGQKAGEETAVSPALDGTGNKGLCHYSVVGPNAAKPPAVLPFALRYPRHPGVMALV